MSIAPTDHLTIFYDHVRSPIRVDEFLRRYNAVFPYVREAGLTVDYRLGRGRLKRLRDEITPAARFARHCAVPDDEIQFPLNDGPFDCHLRRVRPAGKLTIQITLIQARENLNLMNELNATGQGRGFIGLTDDRPTRDFLKAMSREREAYSTDQVRATVSHVLELCAENKRHSEADILIIEEATSMIKLPRARWLEMQDEFAQPVRALRFSEIYLVGDSESEDICMRLK